ncbi:MAG: hypothetical protein QCI82_05290 [Candidatus Thermoplasmatota archaeon]|nr:hypothetical protein [Candidatus Thermoplasmatota archaeon]
MKDGKIYLAASAALVLLTVLVAGCLESEEGQGPTILFNGEEISLDEMFEGYGTITVNTGGKDYTGVPLSNIVNSTGLASPGDHQYRITADDDYYQDVTWDDMMKGVLVEEDTMTAFPGLPGKYRVKNVVEIETVSVPTILVNDHLFTWKQPFHMIDDTVTLKDADENDIEGVYLSQVINLTIANDQASHTYNIIGSDGYNRTVSWEDMTQGILVEEGRKSFFPHLSKKFHISDIVEIEVI